MSLFQKHKLKKIAIVSSTFLATGSLWLAGTAPVFAATNQLYLSPGSVTVQKDASFTVDLRVNPSTAIDTVTASISYDVAKVTLQGVSCTGSPLTAFPSCPTSGNPVSITSYIPGGSVNSDSFIARLTFKAVAGSGTSAIGVSGDTASGGNSLGATSAGANVSFTSPATPPTPTCAAGQTGTYPNCVTPPTTGSGSGSSSGSTSGGGTKTPTSGSTGSTPKPSGGTSTTPTTSVTPVGSGTATVSAKDVKFTLATLTAVSKDPTQVYLQFGTDKSALRQQTALSELGTTHKITVDPSALIPGQTYYYVVVSKTAAGVITQTDVDSFTTSGLTLRLGVFGKLNKPLTNQQVTLHSTPMSAKTDDKGFVSFTNVTPGIHQVLYEKDGKTYTKQVTVDNNVVTVGDTQTAPVQTISVVYDLAASKSLISSFRWVFTGLLAIVALAAVLLFGKRRIHFAAPGGAPLSVAPVVVSDKFKSGSPAAPVTTNSVGPAKTIETSQRLESIVAPNRPIPGSLVTPVSPAPPERKQF